MYKFVFGFALIIIAFWSCTEEFSDVGLGILPTGDLVKVGKVIEKNSIKAYTLTDEIQRTDEPAYNLFGTFNDPVFGKTNSDFACQFRLPAYPDFSKNAKPDSIVLYLLYKEYYGDTTSVQKLRVYELNSDIDYDSKYYQNINLKSLSKSTVLAEKNFRAKLKLDSLSILSTKKNPKDTVIQELAVKIDLALANKLMATDSTTLSDNDLFIKFFKGLYIESVDHEKTGAILKLFTLAAGSQMVLYYHNDEKDSLKFTYGINDATARVNRFSHDYSKTGFATNLDKFVKDDSLIYLQTTGGLRAKIFIPNLGTWSDSTNFAINQAELIFQVDSTISDLSLFKPAPQLVLTAIDKDGKEYFPSDVAFSSTYYGGKYNSADKTYRFNIAKHMQEVIDKKKENHGFYLATAFRSATFNRVVLKGSSSKTGVRLEIVYSKLK